MQGIDPRNLDYFRQSQLCFLPREVKSLFDPLGDGREGRWLFFPHLSQLDLPIVDQVGHLSPFFKIVLVFLFGGGIVVAQHPAGLRELCHA